MYPRTCVTTIVQQKNINHLPPSNRTNQQKTRHREGHSGKTSPILFPLILATKTNGHLVDSNHLRRTRRDSNSGFITKSQA